MGLIKLLIFGVIVWLAINFWRRAQIAKARAAASPTKQNEPPVMVRCAHCQVHLPQDRALRTGDAWYCCAEHRDARSD